MSLANDFKAFVLRGNVVDLAVGVVIGVAFGKIVSSLVDQIIMPPIGMLIGGIDFSSYKWILKAAGVDGKGEVAVQYGAFFNTMIQFLIIAVTIFLVVQLINRMVAKQAAAPTAAAAEVVLLTEIRDLLKTRQ